APEHLYALERAPSATLVCVSCRETVPLPSVPGQLLGDGDAPPYAFFPDPLGVGFVPDPRRDRSFLFTLPWAHAVLSLALYDFKEHFESRNGAGRITDFDYPRRKPEGTYRIL